LDDATFAQIARLRAAGLIAKITLAPEAVLPGQVRKLVAMGAIVSIGHSDATVDQVRSLLAEGAQCFTHLFNAMSPMLGRAAGVTGAAILSDAYCGIICDGHHVSDDMLALAICARRAEDRMFLVSDAMATVGGAEQFDLYGKTISLENGKLVNSEGALAGAHLTMQWALQRAIQCVHIKPEAALKMAVTNPSSLIVRPDLAGLLGRAAKDILILGPDWTLRGFCNNVMPFTK
jgi:N-acetylglucosamine-6-phosphate deacetylase